MYHVTLFILMSDVNNLVSWPRWVPILSWITGWVNVVGWVNLLKPLASTYFTNDCRLRWLLPMPFCPASSLLGLFQLCILNSNHRDGTSFLFTSASPFSRSSSTPSSTPYFRGSIAEHSSGQSVDSSWYRSRCLPVHRPTSAQPALCSRTLSTRPAVGSRITSVVLRTDSSQGPTVSHGFSE